MPRCPVCKIQADPIDYEGARVYNCGGCGGHWMHPQRLEVILSRRDVQMPEPVRQRMMDLADESDSKEVLWCMTCGTAMEKQNFRYWNDIQIDCCPKCAGIWLDRGELEKCQIYWEYAQDHPEEWKHGDVIAKKAKIELQLARRRDELKDIRDAAEAARRLGRTGFFGWLLR